MCIDLPTEVNDKANNSVDIIRNPAVAVNNNTLGRYHPLKNHTRNKTPPSSRAQASEINNLNSNTDKPSNGNI